MSHNIAYTHYRIIDAVSRLGSVCTQLHVVFPMSHNVMLQESLDAAQRTMIFKNTPGNFKHHVVIPFMGHLDNISEMVSELDQKNSKLDKLQHIVAETELIHELCRFVIFSVEMTLKEQHAKSFPNVFSKNVGINLDHFLNARIQLSAIFANSNLTLAERLRSILILRRVLRSTVDEDLRSILDDILTWRHAHNCIW
jgi:hypothetical protein